MRRGATVVAAGIVSLVVAVAGCVPWNQIDGPVAGAGVVYEESGGFSPQVSAGYAYERYRAWYGYAGEAQVTVEPWRKRVSVTPLIRGRFIWFAMALGPTLSWSPDRTTVGVTFEMGAMVALGEGSDCMKKPGPACLDEDDTVYPTYLPRLHYRGIFLLDDPVRMQIGADLLLSSYWLRHGHRRPDDNR